MAGFGDGGGVTGVPARTGAMGVGHVENQGQYGSV